MPTPDNEKLLIEALEALRLQVAALEGRLAKLEGEPAAPLAAAAEEKEDALPEEHLLILSAAIAAFLGKRPRIRSIRLLRSGAWAHGGRVSIQASRLSV
jgi:methylmalonyl-CoA carboxyltransferase large subunit